MNGMDKVKAAVIALNNATSDREAADAALDECKKDEHSAYLECERVIKAVLGSRGSKGVLFAGKLYQVCAPGCTGLSITKMEAEVIT